MDIEQVRISFRDAFGGEPEVISAAPGRVNLIGEHTDYNDGFVFPAAIDRRVWVAARPVDGSSRFISAEMGEAAGFDAGTIQPGEISDWGRYPAGVAWALKDTGTIRNLEAYVCSDIPIGSGVSSSAAIELAFGVIYNTLGRLGLENKELALRGQKAENQFVGVNTGIMDQMASAMGEEGKAMFLDTRSLDITYARVPEDLEIVLCDTKTPRALTSSAYNERRSQCEEAARGLGVKALRDASVDMLNAHKNLMKEVVYRRARHVITENERCRLFVEALNANDRKLMGQLMKLSHESLRYDYEVSSIELDLMAEASWEAPGCVGARMTGAGFGGACVALVEKTRTDEFSESVNSAYKKASGISGEIVSCQPARGARILWPT